MDMYSLPQIESRSLMQRIGWTAKEIHRVVGDHVHAAPNYSAPNNNNAHRIDISRPESIAKSQRQQATSIRWHATSLACVEKVVCEIKAPFLFQQETVASRSYKQ